MKINKSKLKGYLRSSIYIAEEEIPVFCHYVSLAKNILVDIGAGWGTSAFLMLISAPQDALVFSIDPFTGDTIKPWKRASEKMCGENVSRALAAVGKIDALSRWWLFPISSHDAAIQWNRRIDLLYLDGDHRYKAVKQDFEDWFKFMRHKGRILLHDSRRLPRMPANEFARGWPGPTQLVQELRNRRNIRLMNETFSLTVWEKK